MPVETRSQKKKRTENTTTLNFSNEHHDETNKEVNPEPDNTYSFVNCTFNKCNLGFSDMKLNKEQT